MLVRLEKIHNSEKSSVIDELGSYMGDIEEMDFFTEVADTKKSIVEDGYVFYAVDKNKIKNFLK